MTYVAMLPSFAVFLGEQVRDRVVGQEVADRRDEFAAFLAGAVAQCAMRVLLVEEPVAPPEAEAASPGQEEVGPKVLGMRSSQARTALPVHTGFACGRVLRLRYAG